MPDAEMTLEVVAGFPAIVAPRGEVAEPAALVLSVPAPPSMAESRAVIRGRALGVLTAGVRLTSVFVRTGAATPVGDADGSAGAV